MPLSDPLAHRKANARLRLLNPDGSCAAHQAVSVNQVSHSFLFGCGGFDAVRLMDPRDEQDRAFLTQRMEKWLALFNYATLPFYWGRYEPVPGKTAYKQTMAAARWLRGKGVRLKGHPLCWHTVCAPWLLEYTNEEILNKQIERIHREVEAFYGVIDLWDVINEVVIMPVFDRYDNAVTRICRKMGRVPLVKEVFAAAHKSNPGATLLINDFNTGEEYAALIEELLAAGVPIGAIGIQSHQHQGYWGLDKLNNVLERFSRFALPIHFTENTLISGGIMPGRIVDLNDFHPDRWPSTPEGEERQAKEITEMYSCLFAHPLVNAVTTWDFSDGCWLNAPSGLVREDNSEKPSWYGLKKLIHEDWESHLNLSTDENGCLSFTGFKGNYRIETVFGSAAITLEKELDSTLSLT